MIKSLECLIFSIEISGIKLSMPTDEQLGLYVCVDLIDLTPAVDSGLIHGLVFSLSSTKCGSHVCVARVEPSAADSGLADSFS